ncbi:hypothetical protein [Gelidibacter salicanalis]|uniref:Uncharacterized protein n=1 Tax=Gelidibacter salicanalis TaxID=291193 RepID=A0A934KY53_9FLAO|nr:hypothetical protein [Gelidibacter salicanalis]MBJ7882518.1 hypothetical protein [Gelidibacter salicanalis]
MQKHNNIKALFLLGLFSLLLLHNLAPHLHHQHETEHEHSAISHSDGHSHHHNTPEKENSKGGLLDLFLEVHIHSLVSNEILTIQESNVKHLKFKIDVLTAFSVNPYSLLINYDEIEKVAVYHPPNNYFNSYLSSLDTRGPPVLG